MPSSTIATLRFDENITGLSNLSISTDYSRNVYTLYGSIVSVNTALSNMVLIPGASSSSITFKNTPYGKVLNVWRLTTRSPIGQSQTSLVL